MVARNQYRPIRRQCLHRVAPRKLKAIPDTVKQAFIDRSAVQVPLVREAAPGDDCASGPSSMV